MQFAAEVLEPDQESCFFWDIGQNVALSPLQTAIKPITINRLSFGLYLANTDTPALSISRKRRKIHKMWKTSFLGWALASMLILTGSAFADSFTFTSAGSVTWNGVYVNPYQAVDNTHTQYNPLTIYCDDWNTEFSGYPTWNATVYSLTASNVTNFKYGNTTDGPTSADYNVTVDSSHKLLYTSSAIPSAFTRYVEAAYLDQQWENELLSTDPSDLKTTRQKELAAAVWTLFVDVNHVDGLIGAINGSVDTIGGTTYYYADDVAQYLAQAQAAVVPPNGSFTAAGWDVIVPDAAFPMQEFLVHAPEPSAVILLGTVVGVLGLTKFRRKRQA